MSKRVFDDIKAGLEEAIAVGKGELEAARIHVIPAVDVRGLRRRLRLTQAEFARRHGFSIGAVRDWEQGRSNPDAASRAFLLVIEREPAAVARALSGPHDERPEKSMRGSIQA